MLYGREYKEVLRVDTLTSSLCHSVLRHSLRSRSPQSRQRQACTTTKEVWSVCTPLQHACQASVTEKYDHTGGLTKIKCPSGDSVPATGTMGSTSVDSHRPMLVGGGMNVAALRFMSGLRIFRSAMLDHGLLAP